MGPIHDVISEWHRALRGERPLAEILHEDCVFWSPALYRPQHGRELTEMYLQAAFQVLPGDGAAEDRTTDVGESMGSFRYTKRVLDETVAVLEFETRMGGVDINGVDIISCDDDGLITEFRVMIRPFSALETLRDAMLAELNKAG